MKNSKELDIVSNYNSVKLYVDSKVDEYKKFIGIDSFSNYVLEVRELTLDKAKKVGFDLLATVRYDFDMRKKYLYYFKPSCYIKI